MRGTGLAPACLLAVLASGCSTTSGGAGPGPGSGGSLNGASASGGSITSSGGNVDSGAGSGGQIDTQSGTGGGSAGNGNGEAGDTASGGVPGALTTTITGPSGTIPNEAYPENLIGPPREEWASALISPTLEAKHHNQPGVINGYLQLTGNAR